VLPHIRDALEQARIAAKEDAFGNDTSLYKPPPSAKLRVITKTKLGKGGFNCATLSVKEKQVEDMRAYIVDALHLQKRHHTYLRKTHLDPSIGLEVELLSKRYASYSQQQLPIPSNPDINELREALATSELARELLRCEVTQLRSQLDQAVDWNVQLEQERELMYQNFVM
jgi:hypothetical protein